MLKRQLKPAVRHVCTAIVIALLSGCAVQPATEPLNDDPVQTLMRKNASQHSDLYGKWMLMKIESTTPENDYIPPGTEPYLEIALAQAPESTDTDKNKNKNKNKNDQLEASVDGQYSVSLGGIFSCNRFFGNAKLNQNSELNSAKNEHAVQADLSVAPLALTRKACRPPLNKFEHHSVKLLQNSTHYVQQNNESLVLTDNLNNVLQFKKVVTKLLYIEPALVDCMGFVPQKCMRVRESLDANADTQFLYNGIQGFDYEEGFEYIAAVNIVPVAQPPADASSIRHELQELIEKKPAQ